MEEYYGEQCEKEDLFIKPYHAWGGAAVCHRGV